MFFASDNAGPVPQQVLDQMVSANSGYLPSYGADPQMEQVTRLVREKFEAPDAAVYLVGTGTAANALALSTLSQPWETVFCSPVSHIHEDECNAPEFYMGGGKLTLVGDIDKITAEALIKSIEGEENRGVHGPQRGPVSITQITEKGHSYSVEDVQAISNVAKTYGLSLHMDGARFANAIVARNASPSEMTWRAGVDALSFGGTKNGLMGVEGVIFSIRNMHGNLNCVANVGRICFPSTVICRRRCWPILRMICGWIWRAAQMETSHVLKRGWKQFLMCSCVAIQMAT